MPTSKNLSRSVALSLLLAVVTLAVYWRVGHFEYNNFDDQDYVSENAIVQNGLTWEGVRWAFSTSFASNWHPLTWLSHMLDCELFGVNAGAHHLTNVFFHIANTLLLFLVLTKMTGAQGRSAVVAALFAFHPLHVESVAWVAERKDVLSTFFWMLTIWAYARYAQQPKTSRYCLVCLLFVAALMAKPMVVTLPFVLLLLDYWPLGRLKLFYGELPNEKLPKNAPLSGSQTYSLAFLIREKIPLLVLSVASCMATFFAQQKGGAIQSTEVFPLSVRLVNALVAYATYIGKMIVPTNLAALYPHPGAWPVWQALVAGCILVIISIFVIGLRRRAPYLVVGWLWYLGTLVPVLGLIQVGLQWMADRYTYIPLIGLFIMIVWGAMDFSATWHFRKSIFEIGFGLALVGCVVATWFQIQYWQNSITLFRHALAVTSKNAVAHYNLGQALLMQGKMDEPLEHFTEAVKIKPNYSDAENNVGVMLTRLGKLEEATNHYAAAIRINPANTDAQFNYGLALTLLQQPEDAATHFTAALQSKPNHFLAHHALARVLQARNKTDEAIFHYREALKLEPRFAQAHCDLGGALAGQGKLEEALAHYRAATQLQPREADFHQQLGLALATYRRFGEAIAEYRETLRLNSDHAAALNNLTWLLATCPAKEYRNGAEAVRLGERACELTAYKMIPLIGTLAAAYAEADRFDDAIKTAQRAYDLAVSLGQKELAAKNKELLQLYQQGKPYHESP